VRSLLRRLLAPRPAAPPEVLLEAGSGAESTPTSGLISVDTRLAALTPRPAILRAYLPDRAEPFYEQAVALEPEPKRGWFALHGHLLPNGPVRLRLELVDPQGGKLAEKRVTVQVRNQGPLAEATRESLVRSGAPLCVEVCDAALYDYADDSLKAWFDRPPEAVEAHLAGLSARGEASEAEIAALRQFAEDGYLALPDVLDEDLLARLNAALDDAVAKKVEGYEWGASQRLHNLHEQYPAIRELWLHPKVLRLLNLIFEGPARPCQSLTYVFGSEQQYHQDTIHLTPFPAGRMCGVWSALEDIQPQSGELIVYPGSHRLPRVYMKDAGAAKVDGDWTEFGDKVAPMWKAALDAGGFKREVYRPKAGSILIWHENLMHAGMVRRERSKSRRSIVGHYFAEGAVVYFDSSGIPGVVYEGELPA
jgi:ectoine hydroxylase-related dioxygenase (phytanoyl-CoA dioxygenase family)